jgi:hypothetical protein
MRYYFARGGNESDPYRDSSRHHYDEENEQYQLGQTGRQRYVDAAGTGLQVLQGNHLPPPRPRPQPRLP